MTTILHIDSSASDAETSHTRRLTAKLVEGLTANDAGAKVLRRDVVEERLPHVDTTIRQAWQPEAEHKPELKEIATRSRSLVEELKSADILVIGAPMYNFTVPSTLKAWIDHIAIAGQTFRYTEAGPKGLLTGKKAYLALSSGGVYSEGPNASKEHLGSYLTNILNFVGITDIEIVRVEGVALSPERDRAATEGALRLVAELMEDEFETPRLATTA